MKSTVIRIILTIAILATVGIVNYTWRSAAPLISGPAAVAQLDNSDTGFLKARTGMLATGDGIPTIAGLLFVLAVWISPIARWWKGTAVMLLCGLVSLSATAAVMDKDQEEWKVIKPNQTVFMVPANGKNKDNQAAFDSAAYLDVTKIPAKRIQIPHVVWSQKGSMFDKYIPSATLYITTREPYARSWQKEITKGTSNKDEGTYVESSESINVDFGTMIAAEISEKDAALYFYHFGASKKVDNGDDADFPSVVYAKELADVMDNVVWMDAHRLLAREFGKRTILQCISQKAEIFATVEKELKDNYASSGITIKYFGLGSALNLDPAIQTAINNVAIAAMDALAVSNRTATLPVLQALASVNIQNATADAIKKWNGDLKLPSFVILPPGILERVFGLLGPATATAKPVLESK